MPHRHAVYGPRIVTESLQVWQWCPDQWRCIRGCIWESDGSYRDLVLSLPVQGKWLHVDGIWVSSEYREGDGVWVTLYISMNRHLHASPRLPLTSQYLSHAWAMGDVYVLCCWIVQWMWLGSGFFVLPADGFSSSQTVFWKHFFFVVIFLKAWNCCVQINPTKFTLRENMRLWWKMFRLIKGCCLQKSHDIAIVENTKDLNFTNSTAINFLASPTTSWPVHTN